MKNTLSCASALHLDHTKYENMLEAFDLSTEERKALLDALFHIAITFVDQSYFPTEKTTAISPESRY